MITEAITIYTVVAAGFWAYGRWGKGEEHLAALGKAVIWPLTLASDLWDWYQRNKPPAA